MHFRVLGPLEVTGLRDAVQLTAPRQQIVLAMLVLEVNRVVPVERLVDAVWSDSPPPTVRGQIHICVSALRRILADAGLETKIVTKSPGYMLVASNNEIDLNVFNTFVRQGRMALGERRYSEAAQAFRDALGLWRGQPLAGIDSAVVQAAAARIAERRLSVLEECVDLELQLGRHHDLVGELMELVAEYPMRGRPRGHLMLALYRSGRQAEALEKYRELRHTLIEELAIEPGEELQRLEHAILTGDASLEPEPLPPADVPPTPADSSEPGPVVAVPRMLPADNPNFTGHTELTTKLCRHLSGKDQPDGTAPTVPVSVITGRPGVGKTALAVHVAHQVQDTFPDGQIFVRLSDAAGPIDPEQTLERLLRALGVASPAIPPGVQERAALYRSELADRRILVVLDDADTDGQVEPFLPGSPTCSAIVTSRYRLTSVPGGDVVELGVLTVQRSVDLLIAIMGPARVSAEPAAALALVDLCGRLPLALRIAAARLSARPHWTIAQLTERLADEQRRLDELNYGAVGVRSSISLTYESVPPSAQRLFRLLGLLTAPDFPGWIAGPLLGTSRPDLEDLEILVDAQLVDVERGRGRAARYGMHELLRVYARERLAEEEPPEVRLQALRNVLGAWLFLADAAHRRENGGDYQLLHGSADRWPLSDTLVDHLLGDPVEWYESERMSLVPAVIQAAEAGLSEAAWDLSMTMVMLFEARSYRNDWRRTHEAALAACQRAENSRGEAAMLYSLGALSLFEQRFEEAAGRLTLAERVFRATGGAHGLALSLRELAFLDRTEGRSEQAVGRYEKALKLLREVGDVIGEAHVLSDLAQIRFDDGQVDTSDALLRRALNIVVATPNRRLTARVHYRLGEVCLERGDLEQADQEFAHALAGARQLRDQPAEAYALFGLGMVKLRGGWTDAAANTLGRAYALAERCGEHLLTGQLAMSFATHHIAADRPDEAADWIARALEIFGRLGATMWRERTVAMLGRIRWQVDQQHLAETVRDAALDGGPEPSPPAQQLIERLSAFFARPAPELE